MQARSAIEPYDDASDAGGDLANVVWATTAHGCSVSLERELIGASRTVVTRVSWLRTHLETC